MDSQWRKCLWKIGLWNILLISGWHERPSTLWVIPPLGRRWIRKQAWKALGIKPVSNTLPWSLLQSLLPRFPSVMECGLRIVSCFWSWWFIIATLTKRFSEPLWGSDPVYTVIPEWVGWGQWHAFGIMCVQCSWVTWRQNVTLMSGGSHAVGRLLDHIERQWTGRNFLPV